LSQSTHSGGGSGGSVWIKTFRLSGPGYISANGGAGNSNGGGGSGGRVNIYTNKGDFRTGHIINKGVCMCRIKVKEESKI